MEEAAGAVVAAEEAEAVVEEAAGAAAVPRPALCRPSAADGECSDMDTSRRC